MRLNFAALSNPPKQNAGTLGTMGTASNGKALYRPQSFSQSGDARGHSSLEMGSGYAKARVLSPMSPSRSMPWGHAKASVQAVVPAVPIVPGQNQMSEIEREAFEERAAIMEFDGGLSRADAERLAAESMGFGSAR